MDRPSKRELQRIADENPAVRFYIERVKCVVLAAGLDKQWLRMIVEDLLVRGEAFWIPDGPNSLVMDAATIEVLLTEDGALPTPPAAAYRQTVDGNTVLLTADRVRRITWPADGQIYGKGIVERWLETKTFPPMPPIIRDVYNLIGKQSITHAL